MQLFVGIDENDGPKGSVLVSFRGSEVGLRNSICDGSGAGLAAMSVGVAASLC